MENAAREEGALNRLALMRHVENIRYIVSWRLNAYFTTHIDRRTKLYRSNRLNLFDRFLYRARSRISWERRTIWRRRSSRGVVRVRFVYVRRGEMFSRVGRIGGGDRRVETVPKSREKRVRVFSPLLLAASPFQTSLASSLRFVMLIVSNSGHHGYVYFPFSSSFSPSLREPGVSSRYELVPSFACSRIFLFLPAN